MFLKPGGKNLKNNNVVVPTGFEPVFQEGVSQHVRRTTPFLTKADQLLKKGCRPAIV